MSANELNTHELVSDLRRVVEDSEELLRATTGLAGDKAQEVRARMTEALNSAKQTYRRLEQKIVDGTKVADRTIREHPYQSMGITFGVGLLIGVLVARK